MFIRRALALLLVSASFVQCHKELSYVGGPDPDPALPAPITANLQGNVLNENGIPLAGVTVKSGSQTSVTDSRGYFRFNAASLDKNASYISAEMPGYFKGYRSFSATSGTNNVLLKLLPKTLAGTVDAASGGTVTLTNGSKIALPANAVVKKSDNSSITGTVNVYATYIDPTATDINQTIPGSYMANDKNGGRVTLSSYGMIAVELESAAGVPLQVKQGQVATLTTAIPSSLQSAAPASIALWHINESTGIWNEEGTATRQGTAYVGTVSHFSFWNCDVSSTAVLLSMTLHNAQGAPLTATSLRLHRQSGNGGYAYGYTDSLGQVSGLVPSNETLLMEMLDQCGNVYFSQTIGPFTQATNIGIITIPASSSAQVLTVTGQLLTCSNTPVTNGFVRIYHGYSTHYASLDATGHFTSSFSTCTGFASTLEILGVDNANSQQGTSSNIPIVQPITTANVIACGTSATQFINYTLNGTGYSIGANATDSLVAYTGPNGSTTSVSTSLNGFQQVGTNRIALSSNHPTSVAGTYPINFLSVQNFNQVTPDAGSTITFTNFPTATGQFYEGSFTATFASGTNTVSGTFRIRRY
jgi:hypothetical protein